MNNTVLDKVETKFNEQINIEDMYPSMMSIIKHIDEQTNNIHIKAISKKHITFLNKVFIYDFNKTAVGGSMHYIIVDNKIYRRYINMLIDGEMILGSEIVEIRELIPLEMMMGVVETDLGTIEF